MSIGGVAIREFCFFDPWVQRSFVEILQKIKKVEDRIAYLQEQRKGTFPEFYPILKSRLDEERLVLKELSGTRDQRLTYSGTDQKGEGGAGFVVKMTHHLDGREYAFKLPLLNRSAQGQFENELEKLNFLNQAEKIEGKNYVPDLIASFTLVNGRKALQLPLYQRDLFPEGKKGLFFSSKNVLFS